VGKLFGPKGTEADVKQQALDTIQANVAEPKLGSDQTKWNTIYSDLYGKTFGRDNKGWHTFGLANRYTNKAGDVIYKVNKGTTKINVVDSKKLIKY
jgi:hypothetical protein